MNRTYGDTFDLEERLNYHVIHNKKGITGKCLAVCDIEAAIENGNRNLTFKNHVFQPDVELNIDLTPAAVNTACGFRRPVQWYTVNLMDQGDYNTYVKDPDRRLLNFFNIETNKTLRGTTEVYISNSSKHSVYGHTGMNGRVTAIDGSGRLFVSQRNTVAVNGNKVFAKSSVDGGHCFPYLFEMNAANRFILGTFNHQVVPNRLGARVVGITNVHLTVRFNDARNFNLTLEIANKLLQAQKASTPKFTEANIDYYQLKYSTGAVNSEVYCTEMAYKSGAISYSLDGRLTLAHIKLLLKTAAIKPNTSAFVTDYLDKQNFMIADFAGYISTAPDDMSVYKFTSYMISKFDKLDINEILTRSNLLKRGHSKLTASVMKCFYDNKLIGGFAFKGGVSAKYSKYMIFTQEFSYNSNATACELLLAKLKKTYEGSSYANCVSYTTKAYIKKNIISKLNSVNVTVDAAFDDVYLADPTDPTHTLTRNLIKYGIAELGAAIRNFNMPWSNYLLTFLHKPTLIILRSINYNLGTFDFNQKPEEFLAFLEKIVTDHGGHKFIGVEKRVAEEYFGALSKIKYNIKDDTIVVSIKRPTFIRLKKPKRNTAHYVRVCWNNAVFYVNMWFLNKHSTSPVASPVKNLDTFVY